MKLDQPIRDVVERWGDEIAASIPTRPPIGSSTPWITAFVNVTVDGTDLLIFRPESDYFAFGFQVTTIPGYADSLPALSVIPRINGSAIVPANMYLYMPRWGSGPEDLFPLQTLLRRGETFNLFCSNVEIPSGETQVPVITILRGWYV